ncbi:MAG: Gfo/Idh/MocA family oxidoreductase [Armatimonadota bacterium]
MKVDQSLTLPQNAASIYSVGAGGIVENAHYPAYEMMGWQVKGVYDPRHDAAVRLGSRFGFGPVVTSLSELVALNFDEGIFDIAVPGSEVAKVLSQLPRGSFALIQKPLGETLEQAEEIVRISEERELKCAVNFQLRWAPYTLALKQIVAQGLLGDVHDLQVEVNVHTPWALWTFLEKAPRMEMVYHSIHYLDVIRHLFGEPETVFARSIKDPHSPRLESSRSCIYLDYGDWKRATVLTYHGHMAGPRHQDSFLKVEGVKGAAKLQMGLNMAYPGGMSDYLELWCDGMPDWESVPLEGSWFPHAFRGPMADMMRWREGGEAPSTEVHDALKSMRLVDLAYRCSDARGAVFDP